MDVLGGGRAQPGRKDIEIVVGLAGEGEHFAGAHVEGDRGPLERLELGDRLLGGLLQVEIQADLQWRTLARGAFAQRRIDAEAGGIDAEDRAAGVALEQGGRTAVRGRRGRRCP